jgi:ABC-type cobalamin/Fe3+-siderophores transport system ATPase subunit/SAM-dependent methyltransferase
MKVVQFSVPENFGELGLGRISLHSLGDLVVLAGINGSGKSRLLKAVLDVLSAYPNPASIDLMRDDFEKTRRALEDPQLPPPVRQVLSEKVNSLERTLATPRYATIDGRWIENGARPYAPVSTSLSDAAAMTIRDAATSAQLFGSGFGLDRIASSCVPYIATVVRKYFLATHPTTVLDALAVAEAKREFDTLSIEIRRVLGAELAWDSDMLPTLFGRPIACGGLSQGQIFLLQIVVALHAQGSRIRDRILILDEPERHLHPSVLLDVLESLRRAEPAQIWIATHSLPVIAWAPSDSVWLMASGEAKWAGRKPEEVLGALLGDEDRRRKLEMLMQLPAQLAANRYAAECLLEPRTVNTPTDDPQLRQIREQVLGIPKRPIRVLDLGAGKGRLLAALREFFPSAAEFQEMIDYFALDESDADEAACRSVINFAYSGPTSPDRWYGRPDAALAKLDRKSVDVVVLCNVLHEVPPNAWLEFLGPDSVVRALLRDEGHVLIVEDMQIPTGERAHRLGFLLLGEVHIRALFGLKERDGGVTSATDSGGRLSATLVSASLLGRVCSETRHAALRLLRDTARIEVRRIRGAENSYRNGQLYGLWTQLYVNAQEALSEF